MFTPVTASRGLIAAIAAFLMLVQLMPLGVAAAPGLVPGDAVTIASDANVSLMVEPTWSSEAAGEVAPGDWYSIVSGPYYDADGGEWFEIDAGGFLPSNVLSFDGGYSDVAQDVAGDTGYEAAAEISYEDPALTGSGGGFDPNAIIATAWIGGTNGEGAVCRSGASFDGAELMTVWDGDQVGVLGDPVGEWQPVNCGGMAGFVHASFIAWEQPTSYSDSAAGLDGQDSRTYDDAAVVYDASAEAQQPEGDVSADDSDRGARDGAGRGRGGREGGKGRGANAGSDGSSGSEAHEPTRGQEMVDFAMQFVGYPYVYAGEGPYAFDCSGFTLYVARNVLGMEITHDMFTQIEMGTSVGRDELQPGDFVYFANTFRDGLSHVGIYIGDGQFVHAENEDTGVRVSDLDSDYYGPRWYGANRIW